ncbi:Aste57867_20009 [Aphanomyces stellatus]|uniref:Aste57867_20009 protein n=1 Tax=Aphanomyces stellatus TaxID=120398 RepID=A0A485LE35_9STRA|nr:hypothetical protein As57867_019943 [Aphanomyces stellatus]VFT96706.1 Aste57867_20009 [Aphanomyces stellatus]
MPRRDAMGKMTVASLVLLATGTPIARATKTAAAACPYAANPPSATILVADPAVCSATQLCLVDPSCRWIIDIDDGSENVASGNISAIGDIRRFSDKDLTIDTNTTLRVDAMILGPEFRSLTLSNAVLTPDVFHAVNWSAFFLTKLSLNNNGLHAMPSNLPTTLTDLFVNNNPMTSLDGFVAWAGLRTLNLAGNNLFALAHLDWTMLHDLTLDNNANLTTITNVSVTKRLFGFTALHCPIATFVMNRDTYETLAGLDAANPFNTSYLEGYIADSISFSSAACDKALGQAQSLHGATVCVLPRPPSSTSTTSSYTWPLVFGITGALFLAALLWLLYHRRYPKDVRPRRITIAATTYTAAPTNTASSLRGTLHDVALLDLGALELCRLQEKHVDVGRVIASGANGTVSLGTFNGQPVAIKQPAHVTVLAMRKFVDEIKLLAEIDSPHVVTLVGCVWTQPRDMKAVLEWMDSGDLRDYLASHRNLSWPHKVSYLEQIVAGLVYIHTMNVIHRDLKSRNIVLDAVKGAKLTDFGAARVDLHDTMTIGVGTFRWMAPEVLQSHSYSVAADMYSLGVVLSELDTHQIPYSDRTNEKGHPLVDTAIIGLVLAGSLQPTFSSACPPWIRALAQQCLEFDPTKRPTAMQVMYRVQQELRLERRTVLDRNSVIAL